MTPQQKIEALQEKYKKSLPDRFLQISNLFEEYEETGFDAEGFHEFYRLVHNLVGSGATFGLMNVSEKARVLDDLLKPYVIENRLPSLQEHAKIKMAIAMLSRVCIGKNQDIGTGIQMPHTSKETTIASIANGKAYLLLKQDAKQPKIDKQLQNFGFDVTLFHKAEDLLHTLDEQLPALIVLDYTYLDIEALCTQLFLLHEAENNIIIFTIANIDNFATRAKSVQCGCDWYFTHPIESDTLIEKFDMLSNQEVRDPIKVLILDDEIDVANYYASMLEDTGIDTLCIDKPAKIIDTMAEYKPDLLITDLYMHDYSGSDVAKVLRQFDEYVAMPIIFLSIERDEKIQNRAIGSEAEDFMHKATDPVSLITKIKSKVKRYRSMREKIERDSLTNLYNHITVLHFLEKEMEAAKRYNHPLSFVMLDIDFFKKVNDTYGHQTGDMILKSLSYMLKHRVRESDIVGRYGGEEFAVILPYTTLADAIKIIEEIREKFSSLEHTNGEEEFSVTFSAGVCQYIEGVSVAELIEMTDEALYKAKESGRNKTLRCME